MPAESRIHKKALAMMRCWFWRIQYMSNELYYGVLEMNVYDADCRQANRSSDLADSFMEESQWWSVVDACKHA